jgi:hypothetical protein
MEGARYARSNVIGGQNATSGGGGCAASGGGRRTIERLAVCAWAWLFTEERCILLLYVMLLR